MVSLFLQLLEEVIEEDNFLLWRECIKYNRVILHQYTKVNFFTTPKLNEFITIIIIVFFCQTFWILIRPHNPNVFFVLLVTATVLFQPFQHLIRPEIIPGQKCKDPALVTSSVIGWMRRNIWLGICSPMHILTQQAKIPTFAWHHQKCWI